MSTTLLTNSLAKFFLQEGIVLGTNANRILPPFDYREYIGNEKTLKQLDELTMEAAAFDPDGYDEYDPMLDEGVMEYDEEEG